MLSVIPIRWCDFSPFLFSLKWFSQGGNSTPRKSVLLYASSVCMIYCRFPPLESSPFWIHPTPSRSPLTHSLVSPGLYSFARFAIPPFLATISDRVADEFPSPSFSAPYPFNPPMSTDVCLDGIPRVPLFSSFFRRNTPSFQVMQGLISPFTSERLVPLCLSDVQTNSAKVVLRLAATGGSSSSISSRYLRSPS